METSGNAYSDLNVIPWLLLSNSSCSFAIEGTVLASLTIFFFLYGGRPHIGSSVSVKITGKEKKKTIPLVYAGANEGDVPSVAISAETVLKKGWETSVTVLTFPILFFL